MPHRFLLLGLDLGDGFMGMAYYQGNLAPRLLFLFLSVREARLTGKPARKKKPPGAVGGGRAATERWNDR
jgi:hypothetical protein